MTRQMGPKILIFSVLTGWVFLFAACKKDTYSSDSGTFIDNRDQKEYKWVTIGTQTWMAENLAYLPSVSPPLFGSDSTPFCYVFRYEGTNVTTARQWEYYADYGVFYNWTAAMDGADSSHTVPSGVKGICPEGWHLPSDGEWDILVNYLGGEYTAGKKMKATKDWNDYLGVASEGDNSSSFNVLAAGSRQDGGRFYMLGFNALFWSSTGYDKHSAWYRLLVYYHSGVNRQVINKGYGFSVRCVQDN